MLLPTSSHENRHSISSLFFYYFSGNCRAVCSVAMADNVEVVDLSVNRLECGDYSYLAISLKKLWHTDHAHILQRAIQQDASKWIILMLVLLS